MEVEPNLTTTLYKINTYKDIRDMIGFLTNLIDNRILPKTIRFLPLFYNQTGVRPSKRNREYNVNMLAYTITDINDFLENVRVLIPPGAGEIIHQTEMLFRLYTVRLNQFKSTNAVLYENYAIYWMIMLEQDRDILESTSWTKDGWRHFMNSSTTRTLDFDMDKSYKFKKINYTSVADYNDPESVAFFNPIKFNIYIQILNECISIFYIPNFTIPATSYSVIMDIISELYSNRRDSIEIVAGAFMLLLIDTLDISDYDKDKAKIYVHTRLVDTELINYGQDSYRQMLKVRASYWLGPEWDEFQDNMARIIPPPTAPLTESIISLGPDDIYPERIDNIIFKISTQDKISTQEDIVKVLRHFGSNPHFKALTINFIIYNIEEDVTPTSNTIPYSTLDNAYKITNINNFVYNAKSTPSKEFPRIAPKASYMPTLAENFNTTIINKYVRPSDTCYLMGIHGSDYAYMHQRKFSPNSWIWFFQASHTHYMGDGPPPKYHITADEIDTEDPVFHPQITSISNTPVPLKLNQFIETNPNIFRTKPIAYPTHIVADPEIKNRHLTTKTSLIIYPYVHGAIMSNQPLIDGILGHLYKLLTNQFDVLDQFLLSKLAVLITTRTIPEIATDIHANFMYWASQLCNVNYELSILPDLVREFTPSLLEDPTTFIDQPISHFIDTKLDTIRNHSAKYKQLYDQHDNKFKRSKALQLGFTSTLNNTFNAHSRIPHYDVQFALNETNEPGKLISLVGVIPSLVENHTDSTQIATDANRILNQLMDRLNNQTLRPGERSTDPRLAFTIASERISDPSYIVTLSYLLVAIYLGFDGNVVSYIIDPSCKSDSQYKETVLTHIGYRPRAVIRRPIKTHQGQHLVDTSINNTTVNYSEEFAESSRRKQTEGKGKKRIKTKKMGIHKKFTRKSKHHKKKSNTKRNRL
jgi:hypothetical protein